MQTYKVTKKQLLLITQLAGAIYQATDGKLNNPTMAQINTDAREIQLEVDKLLRPEEWQ